MKILTLSDVARRAGVSDVTAQNYHHAATRRRRDGASRPGDLPPPDEVISRSPVWLPETIDTWLANRPGQGKGGGRPKSSTKKNTTKGKTR